jgi:hypothetical protein
MDEIKILFVGDYAPVNRIKHLALSGKYEYIFNDLMAELKDADYSVVPLECTLTNEAKPRNKIGPNIKAGAENINAIKYANFKLIALANNHIMDYGVKGFKSTIAACEKAGIDYMGVGENLELARKIKYKEIKGKRFAFLNFAENEFSTTDGLSPGANPINPVSNFNDIREAQSNSDFVFIIVHGGIENYQYPAPRQKELFRFYVESGANVVLCNHSHCISGYESYKDGFIFYGLGNFVFDWFIDKRVMIDVPWNYGYMVKFNISNELTFNLIPYVQCSSKQGTWLLNSKEKDKFSQNIAQINEIIKNDILLDEQYQLFILQRVKNYKIYIQPHFKRIFRILLKIFPRNNFISRKKLLLLLNIIRCESHRDIFIRVLKLLSEK